MARTAVGYFHDRASADAAFNDLTSHGFDRDDISLMGHGREGQHGLHKEEGATGASGVGVGVVEGILIGAAAMLIPGLGPIVAVGPLAAAVAGAVTGGVTGGIVGGIVGALEDAGVPDEEAKYYDERFRSGGLLLTVRTSDDMRYNDARMMMERHGADVRGSGVGTTSSTGTMGTTSTTTTYGTTRTTGTMGDTGTTRL